MSAAPVRVAVIGTRGCAEAHHNSLVLLEKEGHCRLVATCDPVAHSMPRPEHVSPSLKIHANYLEMLDEIDGKADYVVVPTPIQMHAEMHREVLRRGFACYLEKPPSLDPWEFDGMLKAESSASHASLVGFSHLYRPEYAALKARIVHGEFGPIREVSLLGLSPRVEAYFRRNDWVGKLIWGSRLLLDSCLGNGMSHHVHTLLFWAGQETVWSWGRAEAVRAKLFRVNDIEAPDTVFLEAILSQGVRLRIAMSHACEVGHVVESIQCDLANIRVAYAPSNGIEIQWTHGATETIPLPQKNAYVENHRRYVDYLRGRIERPLTVLSDCRGMVSLNALAYVSAGTVLPVVPGAIHEFSRNGQKGVAVAGIEHAAQSFLQSGLLPDISRGSPSSDSPRWATEDDMSSLIPIISHLTKTAVGIPA